jgi:hypothetical protein
MSNSMNLILPVVSQEPGPAWANKVNQALLDIAEHSHTTEDGVKITPAALNINANIPVNGYTLEAVGAVRLTNRVSPLTNPDDLSCVYQIGGDLYWRNAAGTSIQLTSGSSINIASVGTIGGDYGAPGVTASVAYSDSTKTFTFLQATGSGAKMFSGTIAIANETPSSNAVSVGAGASSAAYSLTLPVAAPGNNTVFSFDNTGVGTFRTITGTAGEITVSPTVSTFQMSLPSTITKNLTFSGTVQLPATVSYTSNGSIVKSGAGALTLSNASAATLSFGGTGTVTAPTGTYTLAGLSLSNNFTVAQTVSASSNQLILHSGVNQLTLNSGTSAAARTYTIPDVGTTANFFMTAGNQTASGDKTFSGAVKTDASHLGGYGLVPVGTVVAYNPGYYTNNTNGGFAHVGPSANTVAAVNTFLNAKGWYVCDGAALNTASSPIWNAASRHLPRLNDDRFLLGSTTAGTAGGSSTTSIAHTHSVTSNVAVANHTLIEANLPSHTHTINHDHASVNSGTSGAHTHTHRQSIGSGSNVVFQVSAANQNAALGSGLIDSAGAHTHSVDLPNFTGTSGATGSGTAVTHSVTNNAVTSGAASVTSVSIMPTYLSTYFIVRVF